MNNKTSPDNNDGVCDGNALGPKVKTTTAVCGTLPCPEISFQSGKPAQTMGRLSTGHGTANDHLQPMADERARQHDQDARDSHLKGVESSE